MKKIVLVGLIIALCATTAYAGWATLCGFDSVSGRNDEIPRGTATNPLYVEFI